MTLYSQETNEGTAWAGTLVDRAFQNLAAIPYSDPPTILFRGSLPWRQGRNYVFQAVQIGGTELTWFAMFDQKKFQLGDHSRKIRFDFSEIHRPIIVNIILKELRCYIYKFQQNITKLEIHRAFIQLMAGQAAILEPYCLSDAEWKKLRSKPITSADIISKAKQKYEKLPYYYKDQDF
ncbi:MAG: hypothetical protein ACFFFG_03980 [Candidatus Thorarchaeota archaeon]